MRIVLRMMKDWLRTTVSMMILWGLCALPSWSQTFDQKIASLGFVKENCIDWSDSADITFAKPTMAYMNLTGFTSFPVTRKTVRKATVEVYDGNGNYFRKRGLVEVQGKSSKQWKKKNFKLDFCEDEWVGDETPDFKIGDWVKQDAFHFKAFYLDFFRGTGIIGYKLYDQMTKDRGEYGRIWERAENINNPDVKALCHPDAFPCAVYLNGKFYGIYAWQLKKHRKNMNMKKNTAEHVHLDGALMNNSTLFDGNISWTEIEVRNPKNLYTMKGEEYDGDFPEELIDETSPYFDLDSDTEEVKACKQRTAKAKQYIERLSFYDQEIQRLIKDKKSTNIIKAAIEERFDVIGLIDYVIHNLVTNNFDGTQKNYQWFTYDGKKWFVAPYDLDTTFGYFASHFIIFEPEFYYIYPFNYWRFTGYGPLRWVEEYYKSDMQQRYAFLRDSGMLNAETIQSLFASWYYAVGESVYKNEWSKWPSSPCIKETIPNEQWTLQPFNYSKYTTTSDYSDTETYNKGSYTRAEYRLWKANTTVTGVTPYKQVGCLDSLNRIKPWTQKRLAALDGWMNYSFSSIPTSYTLSITASGWSTLCVPFCFDIPEGLTLYTVKGKDDNGQVVKQKMKTTEAYKPYLVKGYPGDYTLVGMIEEPDELASDFLINYSLHGCLAETFAPVGSYVLQNHNGITAFYPVNKNGTVKIGTNRAFLTLNEPIPSNSCVTLGADDFTYAVAMDQQAPQIVGIYNTNGLKVDKMVKGVNIVKYDNGHMVKVVVK